MTAVNPARPEPDRLKPMGVENVSLSVEDITTLHAEVFGKVPDKQGRSSLLDRYDPGTTQWLIAEFGDGRIVGACPGKEWRLSSTGPEPLPRFSAPHPGAWHRTSDKDDTDAWRLLEAVVFSANAQIRVGEGARAAWLLRDGDLDALVEKPWLAPRDRSFLLAGYPGNPNRSGRPDRPGQKHRWVSHDDVTFTIAEELSGATVVHPVRWEKPCPASTGKPPQGSWLSVREYWGQDETTGEVVVAAHRLTGYHVGDDPHPEGDTK
ncbi:hypothetical protein [Nocardiopsis ansamitocini]|uniref:Uncharacterized protein n=1 Tax=Nocardiopsis ansamitocini TaxID=1670832 RepID=A0A9W6P9F8_9ACTN|nr:hypothetical protein [Nocardiopsis ansamitocini]GLU49431.1 hypothetical protein Nans01_37820 [Nocardiopsis ansamitocini]